MVYSHPALGEIEIGVTGREIFAPESDGPNHSASINMDAGEDQHPAKLSLTFAAHLAEGIKLLHYVGSAMTDVTTGAIPQLDVEVTWKRGETVPYTRKTDADNIDLLLLAPNGAFLVLQISLVTRDGSFYICCQEKYGGQLVHGADGNVGGIPVYSGNAYPGSGFAKNCHTNAGSLIPYAQRIGYVKEGEFTAAQWNPEDGEDMTLMGTEEMGIVTWFNMVLGIGFIRCRDSEKDIFVHFSKIEEFALRPEARVVFKQIPGQKPGTTQASEVRMV
ncbi:MAG: cold shock domain-containing protein [Candidatus Pacebacteria bacterium]|nr:cold shock domain-containing protein [Candidatus Paceibacterota bacterium]